MARIAASPESSDDDAPEAFSFGSSKKTAKGAQDAVQRFHAAEKLKQKEKNRERDRALKERSAQANAKRKAGAAGKSKVKKLPIVESESEGDEDAEGGERDDLETRMERAMREAEEESSSDEDAAEDHSGGSDEDDVESRSDADEDEQMSLDGNAEEDDEMSESGGDEDEVPTAPKSRTNPNYLPDHLFKSAFSQASQSSSAKRPAAHAPKAPPKKRKRTKRGSQDIVLGSRTIRTLPSSSEGIPSIASRALRPPTRTKRFLNRSLNLKGSVAAAKTKGWERRPANLGVMKRNGPAAGFVRNQ
ncbi:hypothetical protein A0H81_01657 [Grifola frondosa]|uniref:Uncharacterized protein n=1 Tax=Grifola frondosa TaxID=5627 RepID=A0A1C7MNM1_GRIFR|nr:hypothetical protein A0H81_01657 [Grifola frondosa]